MVLSNMVKNNPLGPMIVIDDNGDAYRYDQPHILIYENMHAYDFSESCTDAYYMPDALRIERTEREDPVWTDEQCEVYYDWIEEIALRHSATHILDKTKKL